MIELICLCVRACLCFLKFSLKYFMDTDSLSIAIGTMLFQLDGQWNVRAAAVNLILWSSFQHHYHVSL